MPRPRSLTQGYDRKTWRLMGMGLELGVLIGAVTYLGHLADMEWGTHPWLAALGAILGMVGGCYNLFKEILTPRKPRTPDEPSDPFT